MNEPSHDEVHLRVPYARAANWLRKEIEAGRQLKMRYGFFGPSTSQIETAITTGNRWLDRVRQMLRRIFDAPVIADQWKDASFQQATSENDTLNMNQVGHFNRYRAERIAILDGLLKKVRYMEETQPGQPTSVSNVREASASEETGREVFVVHGHDEAAKNAVARCLMKLDLEPIILEEEPSRGKTIIEKLEASYEADTLVFAVVIMTADDLGAVKTDAENLQPRARQNVIMELGYSIGLLGRDRVCVLYQSGLEMPSDYHGVVFIALDAHEAWIPKLAQELNAAGVHVDLNKAYKLH